MLTRSLPHSLARSHSLGHSLTLTHWLTPLALSLPHSTTGGTEAGRLLEDHRRLVFETYAALLAKLQAERPDLLPKVCG